MTKHMSYVLTHIRDKLEALAGKFYLSYRLKIDLVTRRKCKFNPGISLFSPPTPGSRALPLKVT